MHLTVLCTVIYQPFPLGPFSVALKFSILCKWGLNIHILLLNFFLFSSNLIWNMLRSRQYILKQKHLNCQNGSASKGPCYQADNWVWPLGPTCWRGKEPTFADCPLVSTSTRHTHTWCCSTQTHTYGYRHAK